MRHNLVSEPGQCVCIACAEVGGFLRMSGGVTVFVSTSWCPDEVTDKQSWVAREVGGISIPS